MALKFVVNTLDEVPEANRALYKQVDGKFQLDVDGAVDKSKLDEFRNNNNELKAQIDKYKDVDPVKYKDLMKIQQKLQEKELLEKGEVDQLVELRVKNMREELEGQLTTTKTQLGTANASLAVLMIDNQVKGAAIKAGVQPSAMEDVTLRARQVFQIENGQAVPKGPDGKVIYDAKGEKPITMEDWMVGLKKSAPHLFIGSFGGGAGGGNNPGNGTDMSKMTFQQKIAMGIQQGLTKGPNQPPGA